MFPMFSSTYPFPSHAEAGLSAASPNVPSKLLKENPCQINSCCRETPPLLMLPRATTEPHLQLHPTMHGSMGFLKTSQHWAHQDLALPGSPVLRPALAEPRETGLCPSSEIYTNCGTAGRGLKTQCLHIGGLFLKSQGIHATLYQGGQGNTDNHGELEMWFRKLSANCHLPAEMWYWRAY